MFLSIKRSWWSLGLSVIIVIYSMNFVPRNVAIMAERTLARQIFNYAINIILFFIVIYLLLSLFTWVYKKIFSRKK